MRQPHPITWFRRKADHVHRIGMALTLSTAAAYAAAGVFMILTGERPAVISAYFMATAAALIPCFYIWRSNEWRLIAEIFRHEADTKGELISKLIRGGSLALARMRRLN